MNLEFYRVQDFKGNKPFLVEVNTTFKHLFELIQTKTDHKDFVIFYHWRNLQVEKYSTLTLLQIVNEEPQDQPVFYICDRPTFQHCDIKEKYAQDLKNHLKIQQDKKIVWKGENCHQLYDDRKLALLASSIDYATNQKPYYQEQSNMKRQLCSSIIQDDEPQMVDEKSPGIFRRILMKIGILSKKPTSTNLLKTVNQLKKVDDKQKLKQHVNNKYSDYDPNFASYLEAVYIKFGIFNEFRLHYVQYGTNLNFGMIKRTFPKDAKIGIIGDFGTGLTDSMKLLQHLIMVKNVDIILHLGDVYYAGTPHQYQNNIMKPLKQLRIKKKKQIRFYMIPGNHDYYSWGLPFLCFLKDVNSDQFTRQEASYFCLRSEDNKWQFLGLDSAYHDSNPLDQIDPFSLGPHLRAKQVLWAKDKLTNFPGSTILFTHHQLFSIHDRICGSLTKYRHFSCINPLLSAQLFEYQSSISAWFWGHEHSFMLFQDFVLGVPKCRLLGNSSFHVFSEQKPYGRKEGFPMIPFITDDQSYKSKYLPLSPVSSKQIFYNYCYGFIDFGQNNQKEHVEIQYYCCPCYDNQSKQKKNIFQPYLLYKQEILSRKQIEQKRKIINSGSKVYLKTQIGLMVEKEGLLNLSGCQVQVIKNGTIETKHILNHDEIHIKMQKLPEILEGIWKVQLVLKDKEFISEGEAFTLCNQKGLYLSCSVGIQEGPKLDVGEKKALFMFLNDSFIKI